MKELMKYLGVIITIIGVAILAIPQFTGTTTNGTLATGLVVIIFGIFSFILINKRIEE
ncbi:MAG: hypothetical protein ACRCX4_11050 [Bacteroidales bacterium]